MNRWRLEQDPPLDPVAAIHVLLRRALEADGYAPATDIEKAKDRELQDLVRAFQSASR